MGEKNSSCVWSQTAVWTPYLTGPELTVTGSEGEKVRLSQRRLPLPVTQTEYKESNGKPAGNTLSLWLSGQRTPGIKSCPPHSGFFCLSGRMISLPLPPNIFFFRISENVFNICVKSINKKKKFGQFGQSRGLDLWTFPGSFC